MPKKKNYRHQNSLMALLCGAILSIFATRCGAFQPYCVMTQKTQALMRLPTNLYISFSPISGGANATHFGDYHAERASPGKGLPRAPIKIFPMDKKDPCTGRDPNFNEFHLFLKQLSLKIKNGKKRAMLMDAELKRMEMRYYNLCEDDCPTCQIIDSKFAYQGPKFRPDSKAYAMTINAYTKCGATLTEDLANMTEELALRFEKFNDGHRANAFMIRGIVKALLLAHDLERAQMWMKRMEDTYAETRAPEDAPDAVTYTLFLEALSSSSRSNTTLTAGSISLQILNSMKTQFLSGGNDQVMPTSETYQSVMKCQLESLTGMKVVNSMHAILQQQEKDYYDFGSPDACKVGATCVLPLIDFASKRRGDLQSITVIEKCIDGLQAKFEKTGDLDYQPLDQMFTCLFSAYSKVDFKDSGAMSEKVDRYLAVMDRNRMNPSIYTTTAAIRTKVNDRTENSLREAEELMRGLGEPDAVVYNSLLNGYCRSGDIYKADEILREMDDLFGTDVISMGTCISAFSRSTTSNRKALERSQQLLDEIITRYRKGLVRPREKDVDSWVFEGVARLLVRSRRAESSGSIVNLIHNMEELNKHVSGRFFPSETLYLLAFDAMAASTDNDARQTLNLFEKYGKLVAKSRLPQPSIRLLSSVMVSLARSSRKNSWRDAVRVYDKILNQYEGGKCTEILSARAISSVFSSLLGSNDQAAKDSAMKFLDKTIAVARKNPNHVKLNTITFNGILDGFAATKVSADDAWTAYTQMVQLASEGLDTSPDGRTCSSLAKALGSQRKQSTLERLDCLVSDIKRMNIEGKVSVGIALYNEILMAYRRVWDWQTEAGRRAYDLLLYLEKASVSDSRLAPTSASYRYVCNVLSKSKIPNSHEMLEDLYIRMRDLWNNGDIEFLDGDLCYAIISGYTKLRDTSSIQRAEELVQDMERYQAEIVPRGSKGILDVRMYNRLLFAHASSHADDKAVRALNAFSKMKRAYETYGSPCEPNIHSYNALILAVAKSHPSVGMEAFKIAVAALKALHSKEMPNTTTYVYFIRACLRLLPEGPSQTTFIDRAFTLCQERGLVTPVIIRQVCCVLPHVVDDLEELPSVLTMGDKVRTTYNPQKLRVIPFAWRRHVPDQDQEEKVELISCPSEQSHNSSTNRNNRN